MQQESIISSLVSVILLVQYSLVDIVLGDSQKHVLLLCLNKKTFGGGGDSNAEVVTVVVKAAKQKGIP